MQVILPQHKVQLIVKECNDMMLKTEDTIRNVAKLIGLVVSTFSAVEYGPLHYRAAEREKTKALIFSKGNYDANMSITTQMKQEFQWWAQNLSLQKRDIIKPNPDRIITTDASLKGWCASSDTEQIGGRWNVEEQNQHINYLELLAAFMALRAFNDHIVGKHVHLLMDNTAAISYINNMGGKIQKLNNLVVDIWNWCHIRRIWLSASYIPGITNTKADFASRNFDDRSEWSLNTNVFDEIIKAFGSVDIDLFASRLNTVVDLFPGTESPMLNILMHFQDLGLMMSLCSHLSA